MLTVGAPAKLNLTLEVLGKRPDGFHEIRSVLQSIDLYDTLSFSKGHDISFECDMPGWSADKSLVSRAAGILREAAGYSGGAHIKVEKRIPLMSGLGGDSSDAAALMRALNELWGLSLPAEKLLELAASLGSDVSFFLRGGTALAGGRGEILVPLPPLEKMWVVLVVPDVPVAPGKTGRLYAALKNPHFTDGSITRKLVETLHKGNKVVPSLLFNTFENAAFDFFPGLSVYKDHLVKLGAPSVHLAGSGPTLFTTFADKSEAEDLFTRCIDQGMNAYLVSTL
jgi:4-diphosphocytidyl-2-C-methyl-D-erythritol kinase